MRAAIFVTLFALTACSTSFGRIQAVRDNAPEWYQDRKTELRGEGYPSIADVPKEIDVSQPTQRLAMSRAEVNAAIAMFTNDPRAAEAEETAEDMLIWAAATRRAVEGQVPVPDFLTDEDVIALKARFNTPRGRL